MAIVFKSSNKKKRIIFWVFIFFVFWVLVSVTIFVFPLESIYRLQNILFGEIHTVNDVNVKLDILESDQLKNLEPFLNNREAELDTGNSQPFFPKQK